MSEDGFGFITEAQRRGALSRSWAIAAVVVVASLIVTVIFYPRVWDGADVWFVLMACFCIEKMESHRAWLRGATFALNAAARRRDAQR